MTWAAMWTQAWHPVPCSTAPLGPCLVEPWARLLPRSSCRWRFCPRAARAPSSSNSSRTGNEGVRLPDPRLLPAFSSSGCLVSAEVAPRLSNKDECFSDPLPSPPALS